MNDIVYLDNAASTFPAPELLACMQKHASEGAVNPSAGHALAATLRRRLDQVEKDFLAQLSIRPSDVRVIWTSGATEANNLAICGLRKNLPSSATTLAPPTEHPSVHEALNEFSTGWSPLPLLPDGNLDFDKLPALLSKSVRLISIAAVQNETGVIHDLIRLRRLMDQLAPRARLHVDGVQAFGKIPLPWAAAKIDLLSLTGHKMHGPSGVGCLLIRTGITISPMLIGGGQQHSIRSGSIDGPGIFNFCTAAKLAHQKQAQDHKNATALSTYFWENLKTRHASGSLPAYQRLSPENGSPFICSFSFPAYQGAILVRMLSEHGIMAGSGSACAAESAKPSRVLTAIGIDKKTAFGTIRVSFGRESTKEELDRFFEALEAVIKTW